MEEKENKDIRGEQGKSEDKSNKKSDQDEKDTSNKKKQEKSVKFDGNKESDEDNPVKDNTEDTNVILNSNEYDGKNGKKESPKKEEIKVKEEIEDKEEPAEDDNKEKPVKSIKSDNEEDVNKKEDENQIESEVNEKESPGTDIQKSDKKPEKEEVIQTESFEGKQEGEKESWIGKVKNIFLSVIKKINEFEPWTTLTLIILAVIFGYIVAFYHLWDKFESIFYFVSLALIVKVWLSNIEYKMTPYKKKKKGRFFLILTRSRNRTTLKEAKDYLENEFKGIKKEIYPIVFDEFIGTGKTLTPAEFEIITKEAYKKLKDNKHKELGILVDGPNGLTFMLGQTLGTIFRITFYQYDIDRPDKYYPLPVVSKEWL